MACIEPRDEAQSEWEAWQNRILGGSLMYHVLKLRVLLDRVYHVLKLRGLLDGAIPSDHSSQVTSEWYVERLLNSSNSIIQVMDLGCGTGNSLDLFRRITPDIRWIGLDIEKSPEVVARTRTDGAFVTYDGIHIPFGDNSFDLIYCNQALEHVRNPENVLREVYRLLRPNGYFVGSTSHLEPYHSYSFWNYTPYGFSLLIKDAGLQLLEIRPGIDAFALITTHVLDRFFSSWWAKESPLNCAISILGKVMQIRPESTNAVKLLFCGQFCFLACKPDESDLRHHPIL